MPNKQVFMPHGNFRILRFGLRTPDSWARYPRHRWETNGQTNPLYPLGHCLSGLLLYLSPPNQIRPSRVTKNLPSISFERAKTSKSPIGLDVKKELWGIAKRVSKGCTWVRPDHGMMMRERERPLFEAIGTLRFFHECERP